MRRLAVLSAVTLVSASALLLGGAAPAHAYGGTGATCAAGYTCQSPWQAAGDTYSSDLGLYEQSPEGLVNVLAGQSESAPVLDGLVAGGDGASIGEYFVASSDAGLFPSVDTLVSAGAFEAGATDALVFGTAAATVTVALPLVAAAGLAYLTFHFAWGNSHVQPVVPTTWWPGYPSLQWGNCHDGQGLACLALFPSDAAFTNFHENGIAPFAWNPIEQVTAWAVCSTADTSTCGSAYTAQVAEDFNSIATYAGLFGEGTFTTIPQLPPCDGSGACVVTELELNAAQQTQLVFNDALDYGASPIIAMPSTATPDYTFDSSCAGADARPAAWGHCVNPQVVDDVASNADLANMIDGAIAATIASADSKVALPDCAGMTWAECVAALRAAGVMGWIYPEQGDPASTDAQTGLVEATDPSAATTVWVGTGVYVRLYESPAGDAPPPPDPNGPTDGSPPDSPPPPPPDGGVSCPCDVHALDLGSLSPGSPCDKFPFGVFCWMGNLAGEIFGASPVAPSAHWSGTTLTAARGSIDIPGFTIDAADLPAAFGTWFTILKAALSFLVWVIGLWWIGPRLLGLRGNLSSGGDEGGE